VASGVEAPQSGPIAGVYFRVPDNERVWVGHYRQAHRWMSAAEAAAEFMAAEDAQSWEVVIPRRVEAGELHRVRQLPQVVGCRADLCLPLDLEATYHSACVARRIRELRIHSE
jgi:hypothetical protein